MEVKGGRRPGPEPRAAKRRLASLARTHPLTGVSTLAPYRQDGPRPFCFWLLETFPRVKDPLSAGILTARFESVVAPFRARVSGGDSGYWQIGREVLLFCGGSDVDARGTCPGR